MSSDTLHNTVLARLEYSFKGETVTLETLIDLDRCLANSKDTPDFHRALARAGGVDPYSYLFEILESEEITFLMPTGLAVDCCVNSQFDWDAFVQATRDAQEIRAVQAIAARELGVADINAHAGLKAALLAAYHEGLRGRSSDDHSQIRPSGTVA